MVQLTRCNEIPTVLTANYLITVDDIVGSEKDQFIIIYKYVVNYSTDPRVLALSLSAMNWINCRFHIFPQRGKCPYFFFKSPFYSSGLENERLCCTLPIVSEK